MSPKRLYEEELEGRMSLGSLYCDVGSLVRRVNVKK